MAMQKGTRTSVGGALMEKVPQRLRDLAALARRAGAEILRIRERGAKVREKADSSPVTEADEAAEAVILAGLKELWLDIPVIAEEEAAAGRLPDTGRRFFLVDPLDGTKSFIAGREDFTVNIALIEDGAPVAGVVHVPAKGELYAGDKQAGAFFARGDAPLAPMQHKPRDAGKGLRAVASLNHRDAQTDAWLAAHGVKDVVAAGSSIKLCLLARGEADVYPRFGRTMEWDIAAGQAVLEAAGGRVLEAESGAPLRYGKAVRGFDNPPFIAWAAGVRPS